MRHDLFLYEHDEAMVAKMAPFLESGLADGERAIVVVERRKWDLLADALGSDADTILYVDRDSFYVRPEAALASYDRALRRWLREGASAVRVFGELPRCETDAQWNLWLTYEAILNHAFAHHPVWLMCGYDAREVAEPLLEGGLETHAEVLSDDWARNPYYHDPAEVVRVRTPTPSPLTGLCPLSFDRGPLGFRQGLRAELEGAGVPAPEAENMLVAAGEVLGNAHRHGGEPVSVSVGRVCDRFVCEVSDDGPGLDDPLVGFLPPRPGHASGAGLWVARQLTRQLELVPASRGTIVRLWI